MYHTRMFTVIGALGLVILTATTAEPLPQKVFKVPVELVLAHAVVTDVNRHPITGLGAADFLLKDNGVPQKISYFKPETEPFRVLIALDVSGSTRRKIELIKAAVKRFLRQLGPNDEIALMAFGDRIQMPSGFTSDRKRLERAVDRIRGGPSDKTVLYDALSFAVRVALKGIEGRKALVLLTDGFDTGSGIDATVLNGVLAETDCLIYSLVVNTEVEVRENMIRADPYAPRRSVALVLDSSCEQNEGLVVDAARYFVKRHGNSASIWLLARNCDDGPLVIRAPFPRNYSFEKSRLLEAIRSVRPSQDAKATEDWPLRDPLWKTKLETTLVITDTMEGLEKRVGSCVLFPSQAINVGRGVEPTEWQQRIATALPDLLTTLRLLPEVYRRARHNMEVMTAITGGRAYQLESVQRLDEFYELVARELRQVYTLGFYPSPLTPGFHSLEIGTRTPGQSVRARQTYHR